MILLQTILIMFGGVLANVYSHQPVTISNHK